MVLPRFVDAAIAGEPLVVHDDGLQVRCFAHVKDIVAAVLALVRTPTAIGRVFNIGSDQPVSIRDLAAAVIAASNSKSSIAYQTYTDAYDKDFEDVRRRVPDLSRLRTAIGYRPTYDLEAIVRDVVAWNAANSP
jgi:UDP-glucose 4-epimerase